MGTDDTFLLPAFEELKAEPPASLEDLQAAAAAFSRASRAENTIKAYQTDWADFTRWCARASRTPLPADPRTVSLYLTDLASSRKTSTIRRRIATIAVVHQTAKVKDPTKSPEVKRVWAGIRRMKTTAQTRKRPAITDDIRRMLAELGEDTTIHIRDRALILLGFVGAFRRSELAQVRIDDIEEAPQGLVVHIPRRKNDQEGLGTDIPVPYGEHPETCPVRAIKRWIDQSGITEGPLFREVDRHGNVMDEALSDQTVARVVKRTAKKAGMDWKNYSGHSLRAGFATSAAAADVGEYDIMRQTGHHSLEVLRRYIRDGNLFKHSAASRVGL